MTQAEADALWSAGADPLVVRLAMHPEIPMTYAEANAAPISLLLQCEVLADSIDRIARRRRLLEQHKAALRASAARRRRRG